MVNEKYSTQAQENEISNLIEADLGDFTDDELLELLLGTHVNFDQGQVLVRICMRRFGSLANVVKASPYTLHQIGLPWQVVLAIKFIKAVNERIAPGIVSKAPYENGGFPSIN